MLPDEHNFKMIWEDVVIRRCSNGWMAVSIGDEGQQLCAVYEDKACEMGSAAALHELLFDHFGIYFRQEHRGGLEINFRSKGHG